MPTWELILRSIAGVALMLGNAFFVAVEFALTRIGDYSEEELHEADLGSVYEMTEELEFHLTGCQVGITFTSILLGVVAEPALTYGLMPIFELVGVAESQASVISVTIAVVIINLIHTVWGEQAPTYLGVEKPIEVSRWLAPILVWWTKLIFPLIYVGDLFAKGTLRLFGIEITRSWVGDESADSSGGKGDVRKRLNQALADSKLPSDRRQEIVRAYEIGDEPVSSIMVARDEVVTLSTEKTPAENLELIETSMRTRYPVVGESTDDLVGVAYLPLLLTKIDEWRSGEVSLAELVAEPLVVEPELPISKLIDTFQAEEQEMAFICEESAVAGIVTSTDAFESMFGELRDPLD